MATGPRLTSSGALYLPGTLDEVTYSPSNLADSKNLFTNSQDFSSQGYWIATGSSYSPVATDAVAPDGTLTASLFTATGLYPNVTKYYAGFQGIVAQPGEVYTFSVYLKYVNQPVACLVQEDGWSGFYAIVNIQTGTVVANGFAITSSSVTDVGNGWYRCSATFTIPSLQVSWTNGSQYYYNTTNPIPVVKFDPQIRLGNYDGTNYAGKQMLVWGAQLEKSSTATTYQPTGIPANYFKFTQNFSQAGSGVGSWYFYNNASTASDNVTLAPDGTMTGAILVSTVGPGAYNTAFIDQHPTVGVNNTNFTYSIYLKQGTSPTTLVDFYNSNPYNEITATVTWGPTPTMVTGTGSGGVVVASSFTAAPNGWYRVSLTINTLNNIGVLNCRVYVRGQNNDNVVGEYVYIWGAQLEQGSAPTAYVANGINITKIKQLTQVFNNNLLTYSQLFSDSSWTKTRASIATTTATTAPDGTSTALKLVSDSSAATSHYCYKSQSVLTGATYTFSIFAKAAEFNNAYIQFYNTNGAFNTTYAYFDLVAGVVGSTSGSVYNATINNLGNGWYRISLSSIAVATVAGNVTFQLANNGSASINGDGVSGVYFWGAQFEYGTLPTPYQANSGTITTVVPVTQAASKNTSDGSVLVPGTFDEVTYNSTSPTIVNLFAYSEQYNQTSAWATQAATISANQTTAPNNTLTADKLIENVTTTNKEVSQYISVTAGTTYTYSAFVKAAGRTNFRFGFSTGSFANGLGTNALFNLTTGTVYQTTGGVSSASITDAGNGWYRCVATVTPTVSTVGGINNFICYITLLDGTYSSGYLGDGTSGLYLWGSQLEISSSASIYQGTTTTNTLITTGMAQRVTNSGNMYVASNFDEFSKLLPVTTGLLLNLDATAYVSGSTWQNQTANGYNATLVNSPVYSSNNGGILQFTGNPSIPTYVTTTIPSSTFTPSSNWTMTTWVRFNASNNSLAYLSPRPDGRGYYGSSGNLLGCVYYGNYGLFWTTSIVDGNKGFYAGSQVRTGPVYAESNIQTSALSFGVWYNVTGVYDFTNNSHKLYLNGSLVNSTTAISTGTFQGLASVPYIVSGTNDVYGGSSSGRVLDGDLGQNLIYSRALSAQEVLDNYNALKGRYGY